jgi:thiamine biosynthesis protein ThiI
MDGVLVRFGEIGIKSAPVRRAMVERLRRNLLDGLVRGRVEGDVLQAGSRVWLVGPDPMALAQVAARTFGVVSASPCRRVGASMETLCAAAAEAAAGLPGKTFAVRARREGSHPYSSMDVQVQAGSRVFTTRRDAGQPVEVDLDRPDFEVHIDIRQDQAFVFTQTLEGPGGLPVGSQGLVLALVSDEASFVATWLMMRRGCAVAYLHSGDTGSVPTEGVEAMAAWGGPRDVEVLPVCSGRTAKPVLLAAACEVARGAGALALVTGDRLGSDLRGGVAFPVLRPVCGLDPDEYAAVLGRLGLRMEAPTSILDPAARETVESLLSMRRTVTA